MECSPKVLALICLSRLDRAEACPTRLLEGLDSRDRAGGCRFRFHRLKKRSHHPSGYMESSYSYAFEGSWRHRTYPTFPGFGAPPAFLGAALSLYRTGGGAHSRHKPTLP